MLYSVELSPTRKWLAWTFTSKSWSYNILKFVVLLTKSARKIWLKKKDPSRPLCSGTSWTIKSTHRPIKIIWRKKGDGLCTPGSGVVCVLPSYRVPSHMTGTRLATSWQAQEIACGGTLCGVYLVLSYVPFGWELSIWLDFEHKHLYLTIFGELNRQRLTMKLRDWRRRLLDYSKRMQQKTDPLQKHFWLSEAGRALKWSF